MGCMQSRVAVGDVSPPASPQRETTIIVTEERSTNDDLDSFLKDYHKSCNEILIFLPDLKDKAELLAHYAGGNPDPELEKLREFIYELTLPRDRLNSTIHELERKLRAIKTWRKLFTAYYSFAFVTVLICPVVLTAVGAPATASSAADAASKVMMPLKQWLDSFLDEFQISCEKKRDAVAKIEKENSMAIDGLKKIREMVEHLKMESLEDLEKALDCFGADLQAAIATVLSILC